MDSPVSFEDIVSMQLTMTVSCELSPATRFQCRPGALNKFRRTFWRMTISLDDLNIHFNSCSRNTGKWACDKWEPPPLRRPTLRSSQSPGLDTTACIPTTRLILSDTHVELHLGTVRTMKEFVLSPQEEFRLQTCPYVSCSCTSHACATSCWSGRRTSFPS